MPGEICEVDWCEDEAVIQLAGKWLCRECRDRHCLITPMGYPIEKTAEGMPQDAG